MRRLLATVEALPVAIDYRILEDYQEWRHAVWRHILARPRVRQDPKTNKWIVEYYDKDKKQHRLKGFLTKRSANNRASEIDAELRGGVHTPASTSGTVEDACDVWIHRAEELELDKKTISQYRNHTDIHIIPVTDSNKPPARPAWEGPLGKVKLSRLTPPIARAVQRREFIRRLSRAMARKVMVSFKSVLNEAANNAMIAYNPALTVKNERRKRGEDRVNKGVDFPLKA